VASGARLQALSTTAFSGSSDFTVNGILDLGGNSSTIRSLSGAGFVLSGAHTPATLTIAPLSGSFTFSGSILDGPPLSAPLSLVKSGAGTQILSGGFNSYTGATTVSAGKLLVNSSLTASSVTVQSGGTFGGTGSVTNGVTVQSGGTLAPGGLATPGTLMVGSLTLNTGSLLAYRLGTASDLTVVSGALTLAGTLSVTDAGGFGLGSYRIFNYGTLTNNGLALGTLPAGFTGVIQTGVPGQINLIAETPGTQTQFWDGATTVGDGRIHGGSGTWKAATENWTTPDGHANTFWQSGFAIFAGSPRHGAGRQ
jgi:autotransporter-associated beta strand protein